jgi:hypothetical protein
LPQQPKVVLGGLRSLHRLTPAVYTRTGRLGGLEAEFVPGAIERAARVASLADSAVLELLLPLIKSHSPAARQAPPDAASRAQERLVADEIVLINGTRAI